MSENPSWVVSPKVVSHQAVEDEFEKAEAQYQQTILDTAKKITSSDRNEAYGHPYQNHTCTAEFWSSYRQRRQERSSDALDVCVEMILTKISRLANRRGDLKSSLDFLIQHMDTITDIAGYARNMEQIVEAVWEAEQNA